MLLRQAHLKYCYVVLSHIAIGPVIHCASCGIDMLTSPTALRLLTSGEVNQGEKGQNQEFNK